MTNSCFYLFFPKRLLLTLIAGEDAGGDKRGCMSAAIEYFKPNRRIMTLRIDYSNNPLKELSLALEQRYSKECKEAFDRRKYCLKTYCNNLSTFLVVGGKFWLHIGYTRAPDF